MQATNTILYRMEHNNLIVCIIFVFVKYISKRVHHIYFKKDLPDLSQPCMVEFGIVCSLPLRSGRRHFFFKCMTVEMIYFLHSV